MSYQITAPRAASNLLCSVPTIPLMPPTLRAPGYTPAALAARERFLRDAAAAWDRAGDSTTAARLTRDADVQRSRHHQEN